MSDSSNPFIGNPFAQGVDKQKKTPPPQTQTIPKPNSAQDRVTAKQQAQSVGGSTRTAGRAAGRGATSLPKTGPQSNASTARSTAQPKGLATPSSRTASPRGSRNTAVPPAISTPDTASPNRGKARGRQTDETATSTTPKKQTKSRKSAASKKTSASPQNQPMVSPPPAPAYSGAGYKVQVLAKIPVSTNTNMPGRDYLWFAVYPIIPRVGDCIFNNGMYFRVDTVILYENTGLGWCADIEVSYFPKRR